MMRTFYWLLILTVLLLTACNGRQQVNPSKGAASSLATPTAPAKAPAPVSVQVPTRYQGAYPGGDRKLQVPPGFTIQVFAAGLQRPRHMALGPDGAIYVAKMGANRVSRLADTDGDGVADSSEIYASNVESAHGVEWHQGALYVGATDGIYRFDGKGASPVLFLTPPRREVSPVYQQLDYSTSHLLYLYYA
ncbi:hypothetical protein [Ectobacillus polymachus]|uniref:DUF7133 domain-containing protein n=1 Tax=Ectobacillus polymachus TaxID=1508806 RepID=UPI003A8C350C